MSDPDTPEFSEWVMGQLEKIQQEINTLRDATTSVPTATLWPGPTPDLVEWVEGWLVPTFDMGVDVRNWQDIPALVSELSALWVGYNAMNGPTAGGFDPIVWHSHLASARSRMAEYSKRARHREAQLDPW